MKATYSISISFPIFCISCGSVKKDNLLVSVARIPAKSYCAVHCVYSALQDGWQLAELGLNGFVYRGFQVC